MSRLRYGWPVRGFWAGLGVGVIVGFVLAALAGVAYIVKISGAFWRSK